MRYFDDQCMLIKEFLLLIR